MESASRPAGNDRVLKWTAAALAALLHVGIFHLLGQGGPTMASGAGARARELRVEFIEVVQRPVAAAPRAKPRARTTLPSRPRPAPLRSAPVLRQAVPLADTATAVTPAPQAPLVMEWTDGKDAGPGFRMNLPDGRLPEALVMGEPDQMRVRRQLTGKDVVEGAAQLLGLWPEGYATDPCPRIRRNIGKLMTDTGATGRQRLGEELRRQRAACP